MCASVESNQPAHLHSLVSVFVVRMEKLCILGYPNYTKPRFWSDCAHAQVDIILRWAHMSENTFSEAVEHKLALSLQDQTWFFNALTFTRSPGRCWKPRPSRGFQYLSRDLANVNALKNHVWSLLLHKNWKHLLHFALFLALFCYAFSPMSRERNFHRLCTF